MLHFVLLILFYYKKQKCSMISSFVFYYDISVFENQFFLFFSEFKLLIQQYFIRNGCGRKLFTSCDVFRARAKSHTR